MTNVTARPIPTAVSLFFDTPRNGQIPRNCEKMKLFVRIAPREIARSFVTLIYLPSVSFAFAFFFSLLASAHCMMAISVPRHRKPPTGSVSIPAGT